MHPNDDDPVAARAAREAYIRQREREKLGINAAAEMGVFDPGRPKELDLVEQRDRYLAAQWEREFRPQDHTAPSMIPVSRDDGPARDDGIVASAKAHADFFETGAATQGKVVAADWDAPLEPVPLTESFELEGEALPPAPVRSAPGEDDGRDAALAAAAERTAAAVQRPAPKRKPPKKST